MMKDLTSMLWPISHIVSYVVDDNQVLALFSPFGRDGGPGFSLLVHVVVRTDQVPVPIGGTFMHGTNVIRWTLDEHEMNIR